MRSPVWIAAASLLLAGGTAAVAQSGRTPTQTTGTNAGGQTDAGALSGSQYGQGAGKAGGQTATAAKVRARAAKTPSARASGKKVPGGKSRVGITGKAGTGAQGGG